MSIETARRLQISAATGQDARVLQLAYAYEQATDRHLGKSRPDTYRLKKHSALTLNAALVRRGVDAHALLGPGQLLPLRQKPDPAGFRIGAEEPGARQRANPAVLGIAREQTARDSKDVH